MDWSHFNGYAFPSFFSNFKFTKEGRGRQGHKAGTGLSMVATKHLVSSTGKIDAIKTDVSPKEYEHRAKHSLGLQPKASSIYKNEVDFCHLVCILLYKKFFSKRFADHIAKHSWHEPTLCRYNTNTKRWLLFGEKNNKEVIDFSMNTIIDFLLDVFYDPDNSFNTKVFSITTQI